jgi:hypothetical protein
MGPDSDMPQLARMPGEPDEAFAERWRAHVEVQLVVQRSRMSSIAHDLVLLREENAERGQVELHLVDRVDAARAEILARLDAKEARDAARSSELCRHVVKGLEGAAAVVRDSKPIQAGITAVLLAFALLLASLAVESLTTPWGDVQFGEPISSPPSE